MGTMLIAKHSHVAMSMEYAQIDAIKKVELCVFELMANKEDTTFSRAQELLEHLSTSPKHLVLCLNLLQEKVAAENDNWSLNIKLLLLLHHLLADSYHLLESIPNSKDHLLSILQGIKATTRNSFLQSYSRYLMYTLWEQPMPFKDDASDFIEVLPALQSRIFLLIRCKLDTTSDVYFSGLALCGVDFLVRDGYCLYKYLRKGMDNLLENIAQPRYQSWHMQALSVGEQLINFLSFAREMAESRVSNQAVNPNVSKEEQVTALDNIQKQLKTMAQEMQGVKTMVQKLTTDTTEVKIMQHTAGAIQATENCSTSKIAEETNKLRRLLKHDIKSIVDARAFKTDAKVEKLDRHIGSFHEKLCRVLLGRNIDQLVGDGFTELAGFGSFHARLSQSFVCLAQICNYLQLSIDEEASVRARLLQILLSQDVGACVFKSFLQVLNCEIQKKYSIGKWPRFAKRIKEEVENLLEQLPMSQPMNEILRTLKSISEMVKMNAKQEDDSLHLLGHHILDVIELLSATFRKDMTECDIMSSPWGLLVLFWVLKQCFRHPILEVDVCGSVSRNGMQWTVWCGEVKSSEGVAIDKGKSQLNLMESVYWQVLEMAVDQPDVKVIKCLFTVLTTQGKLRRVVEKDDDILIVDIGQLSY